ncbi:MAG: isocitrate lyase/PEP mutase family protein [Burkholderiales bacterium]
MTQAAKLRKALAGKSLIAAPGAYDCIGARLIEHAGFEAVYMTGAGTAASLCGFPDYGLLTMTEMVDVAGRIAGAVNVPVIADADTGFGNELNVVRTVREYERRGVAALHIEDQVFPKRCGHFEGKEVIPGGEFLSKIKAAAAARANPDTLIIARTDALAVHGFEEAVSRMNAALGAGADVAFLEAIETMDQMRETPRLIRGPCLLNLAPGGGRTPRVDLNQAADMGYRIVTLSGLLTRHVLQSCQELLQELFETRAYPVSAKESKSMKELALRMGSESWDRWRM